MKRIVGVFSIYLVILSFCLQGFADGEMSKILSKIRKAMEAPNLEIVARTEGYFYEPQSENKGRISPQVFRFLADSSGKWRCETNTLLDENASLISYSIYDGKYWWKYIKNKNVFSKQIITPGLANHTKQTYIKIILSGWPIGVFTYNDKDPQQKKFWDFSKATLKETTINGRKALLLMVPSFKEALKGYSWETKKLESASTLTFKVWIDPKTYLPIEVQTEEKLEKAEDPKFEGRINVHSHKILKFSLNPVIKKGMFLFTPPKGAKEVSPAELANLLR